MEPACKETIQRLFQEDPEEAAELVRVIGEARIQTVYKDWKWIKFPEEALKWGLQEEFVEAHSTFRHIQSLIAMYFTGILGKHEALQTCRSTH